jgi:recombination protein RecA
MFGEGISKIGEILDIGVDAGIIKKSGSWFSYGDRKLAQGRDAVKELLTSDEQLRDEIEQKVRVALKEGTLNADAPKVAKKTVEESAESED